MLQFIITTQDCLPQRLLLLFFSCVNFKQVINDYIDPHTEGQRKAGRQAGRQADNIYDN
jgi:hypothetical protein